MIISSALASSPREQFSCSTYYIVTLLLLHYCYCVALCVGHVGAKSHIPLIEDATVMERWSKPRRRRECRFKKRECRYNYSV